jgi:small GTP-binding protein
MFSDLTSDGKVVLLGSESVGKTSIVSRVLGHPFDVKYAPTVGSQYAVHVVDTHGGKAALRIWDTAGQERYRTLAPMYYQQTQIAIVVFSIAQADSLADAQRWISELNDHIANPPALFLVGNKADLADRCVSLEQALEVGAALNAVYFETSAKTGANIHELFEAAAVALLQRRTEPVGETVLEQLSPVRGERCRC